MTYRSREGYLAASKEFAPFPQPGSVLFAQPAEVDHWCQSITYPDSGYPLTPPDTASDCAPSDCSDMNVPSWTQAPVPEESWATAHNPEHSTFVQNQWQPTPLTTQELQTSDSSSWYSISQGPVDTGLSPVLSHESQSTHTLNCISEPELLPLPPGLDLSFIGEPTWDNAGSVVCPGSTISQDFASSMVSSPEVLAPLYPVSAASLPPSCGPQQSAVYYSAPYPRRTTSDPVLSQRRPILPRAEGASSPEIHSQPHVGLAQIPGAGRADAASSVSNATGLSKDAPYPHGPVHVVPQQARMSPVGHGLLTPRPDSAPCQTVPQAYYPESNRGEMSALVRYDQAGNMMASSESYAYGFGQAQQMPASMSGPKEMKSADVFKGPMPVQSSSSAASMTSESDEGRHRNDPLYSRGPESDGLYHCPFKSDPNCQHKPTKLKCNYDKFIDSHLKPFRCKVEACSKQEFSSTACLLRHEREAHGMHGHGDRPHLCYYGGCERGIPGNGFPRRYNLFDHMKRVHDHKDEPNQDRGSPEGRKASGRKRKATGSISEEPAAQRPKIQQIPTPVSEPSPVMAVPQTTYVATDVPYTEDYRTIHNRQQRAAYSQWANQRQLLEFSVNSVNGPQDEANLQRLSQNVEELRRLSQQARHG
ncbi:hypothetical protein HII31_11816 [Pseudocercospora fuligena]|uniref:C2H2-type domain-containing protein n=1 Tax=Pseudocercospora fuligena TaxID=685502 RepID=A0A8H6R6I7_9PEZI|nr:hypothetical protein HII31_11816 [Pseudocercospora fuligena]